MLIIGNGYTIRQLNDVAISLSAINSNIAAVGKINHCAALWIFFVDCYYCNILLFLIDVG